MTNAMEAALNAPVRHNWTTANLETAMCLWEAALDLRDRLPALSAEWEAHGTVALRHRLISLVPACEKAWEDARAAGTEQVPYDWEHCPAFLISEFGPLVERRSVDGPYRPHLAEAFREGARELQIDRLHVDRDARIEEGEGGAIVHCTVFVSDSERMPIPEDDDDRPECLGDSGDRHDGRSTFAGREAEMPTQERSPLMRYNVKFWRSCTTADRCSITVEADSPQAARAKVLAWGTGVGELTEEEELSETVEREEVQNSEFDALLDATEPYAVTLLSN